MSLAKAIKLMQPVTFSFLVVMAFEFIFGFTGTTLIIEGAAIRHIVFIIAFVSTAFLCILYMLEHKIALVSHNKSSSIFRYFSRLQWSVSILLVSMLVSMTLIPYLRNNSLQLAKSEALDSFIMLALFLPLSFLIRWRLFNYKLYGKILFAFMAIFSAMHIILYIGQSLNQNYIEMVLGHIQRRLDAISGVQSIFPQIILGHNGYPRVIFTTSIYLVYSIYSILAETVKNRLINSIVIAIHIAAILTTMTKSIWLGILIGLFCYVIMMFGFSKSRGRFLLKTSLTVLAICGYILLLNYSVFHNQVYLRLSNTFMISSSSVTESEVSDTTDNKQIEKKKTETDATVESNQATVVEDDHLFQNNEQAAAGESDDTKITQTNMISSSSTAESEGSGSAENKQTEKKKTETDGTVATNQATADEDNQVPQNNEQAAAVESNDIKITQTRLLLNEWLKHPILGNGFGSYIKNYIRSQEAVFSYEMQAPALLMKVGLLGVSLVLLTVFMAFYNVLHNSYLHPKAKAAWVYLTIAFIMAVQTNPLLLSYPGISIFVIILVLSENNSGSKVASIQKTGQV